MNISMELIKGGGAYLVLRVLCFFPQWKTRTLAWLPKFTPSCEWMACVPCRTGLYLGYAPSCHRTTAETDPRTPRDPGRRDEAYLGDRTCMCNYRGVDKRYVNKVACHPSVLVTADTVIWGVYLQATTHVSVSLKHPTSAKKHLDLLKLLIRLPCELPCCVFHKTIKITEFIKQKSLAAFII